MDGPIYIFPADTGVLYLPSCCGRYPTFDDVLQSCAEQFFQGLPEWIFKNIIDYVHILVLTGGGQIVFEGNF